MFALLTIGRESRKEGTQGSVQDISPREIVGTEARALLTVHELWDLSRSRTVQPSTLLMDGHLTRTRGTKVAEWADDPVPSFISAARVTIVRANIGFPSIFPRTPFRANFRVADKSET